jgi:hypothetical protein
MESRRNLLGGFVFRRLLTSGPFSPRLKEERPKGRSGLTSSLLNGRLRLSKDKGGNSRQDIDN